MLNVLSDSELRKVYEELLVRKDGFASVSQKGSASVPHCCASDEGFKLICAFDDESAVVEDIPSFPSSDFLEFLGHFKSVIDEAGIVRCHSCGCYCWETDSTRLYSHDECDEFDFCPDCVEDGSATHTCCRGCGTEATGCWVRNDELTYYSHVEKSAIDEQYFGTPTVCDEHLDTLEFCMNCGARHDSQGACPECNCMSVLHRLGGPLDIKILCLVTELNGSPCLEYHPSVLGSVFRFSVGYSLDGRVVPVSFETTDELFEFTHKELSDGKFVHYLLVASGLFDCECAYDSYEYNKFHSEEVDCDEGTC